MNYLLVISVNAVITPGRAYRFLFTMPIIILITYFILYYIIPSLSKKPSIGKLIVWVFFILGCLGFGVHYYTNYIINPIFDPAFKLPADVWDLRRVLEEVFRWATVIFMAIAIKLIKNKTELEQKNNQLAEEKRMAELGFLKSQMHPHFLFNTLNTLYSDAIRGNGKSEEIVLRLSNLMRFILDECNEPLIRLEKEIKVIEDYIALETLRHGDRLKFDLRLSVEDKGKLISPLLMLPFVENSCKHTLRSKRGPILITVQITSAQGSLHLLVENEWVATGPSDGPHPSLGISNIKKQLFLLYGPQFKLDINKDHGRYRVSLQIPI